MTRVSSPLNVQLEQFEGPLDLLLELIRKQEIDIHDIPIARITSQYMLYLDSAAERDIEVSAEFVYMAATLIHIKSKMLLPRDPELQKILPEEDPRKELVDRLMQHERFKTAAEMLQQKRVIEEAVWTNSQIKTFDEETDPGLKVSLFDLVKTLQEVVERVKSRPIYSVEDDDVNVPQMVRYLSDQLHASNGQRISATKLFEAQKSRRGIICLFLAILEMVKRQALTLEQSESFSDIDIQRTENYEEVLASAENSVSLEQEYQ
jgi:segregation and condensation protein A